MTRNPLFQPALLLELGSKAGVPVPKTRFIPFELTRTEIKPDSALKFLRSAAACSSLHDLTACLLVLSKIRLQSPGTETWPHKITQYNVYSDSAQQVPEAYSRHTLLLKLLHSHFD